MAILYGAPKQPRLKRLRGTRGRALGAAQAGPRVGPSGPTDVGTRIDRGMRGRGLKIDPWGGGGSVPARRPKRAKAREEVAGCLSCMVEQRREELGFPPALVTAVTAAAPSFLNAVFGPGRAAPPPPPPPPPCTTWERFANWFGFPPKRPCTF